MSVAVLALRKERQLRKVAVRRIEVVEARMKLVEVELRRMKRKLRSMAEQDAVQQEGTVTPREVKHTHLQLQEKLSDHQMAQGGPTPALGSTPRPSSGLARKRPQDGTLVAATKRPRHSDGAARMGNHNGVDLASRNSSGSAGAGAHKVQEPPAGQRAAGPGPAVDDGAVEGSVTAARAASVEVRAARAGGWQRCRTPHQSARPCSDGAGAAAAAVEVLGAAGAAPSRLAATTGHPPGAAPVAVATAAVGTSKPKRRQGKNIANTSDAVGGPSAASNDNPQPAKQLSAQPPQQPSQPSQQPHKESLRGGLSKRQQEGSQQEEIECGGAAGGPAGGAYERARGTSSGSRLPQGAALTSSGGSGGSGIGRTTAAACPTAAVVAVATALVVGAGAGSGARQPGGVQVQAQPVVAAQQQQQPQQPQGPQEHVKKIRTFKRLAKWLVKQQARGGGADSNGGQLPWAVADLRGRTLQAVAPAAAADQGPAGAVLPSAPVLLRLPHGVELRNGTLQGCRLEVGEEGGVVKARLTMLKLVAARSAAVPQQGQGTECHSAVVSVLGAGSLVTLVDCTVQVEEAEAAGGGQEAVGAGQGPDGCVLALGGGEVVLRGCELSGGRLFGLAARGGDSVARAVCTIARGNGDGFAAVDGGLLTASDCKALGNSMDGFCATSRGTLAAADLCVAEANGETGFFASGRGSRLAAGPGCVAERNELGGFVAMLRGQLTADEGCAARHNGDQGFTADGNGSVVSLGADCEALTNWSGGFVAVCGGTLEAGPRCVARGNGTDGFVADKQGSLLRAGMGCKAVHNKARGYSAQDGARLVAGGGCSASANGQEGFAALGATVELGGGCRAARNKGDGFTVADAGSLEVLVRDEQEEEEVQQGILAQRNGGCGFVSEDAHSRLVLRGAAASRALDNARDGFAARAGGQLRLAAAGGAEAARNSGCGYLASGWRALLQRDPARCTGEANGGGNSLREHGGRLGVLLAADRGATA